MANPSATKAPASQPSLTKQQLEELVRSVPFWFHGIDMGHGVVTPGLKPKATLDQEALSFPDVKGKSVLDLGAWDGGHTFWAERNGAARVVALDHFAWATDRQAQELLKGQVDKWEDTPAWRPDTLPGKAGFDLAHRALGSKVEVVVADFMNEDLTELGSFDVVLFLGQLYHHQDPVKSLKRVHSLTAGMAVVETEAVFIHGFEDRPLCEFFEDSERVTNWFIPNLEAVKAMCRRAGFSRVDVIREAPVGPRSGLRSIGGHTLRELGIKPRLEPVHYRAIVHAWK